MAWAGSLRARITIGMLVLASLSSLLFAFGVYLANEGLETTVLQEVVQHEFNSLAASSLKDPEQEHIHSALLQGYVGQANAKLPPELLALEPGIYHSLVIGDEMYEVLVGDDKGRRIYVAYNITDWEIREDYMIGVLVAIALFAFYYWTAAHAGYQKKRPLQPLSINLMSKTRHRIPTIAESCSQELQGLLSCQAGFCAL